MVAVLSLVLLVALSLIVMRVGAMALRLTGLSQESSRFQACSAFTGVGFSTSESEAVVNHPVRRRIVMLLMLLGNLGVATVMASMVLSLFSAAKSEEWWWYPVMMLLGVMVLVTLAVSRSVERRLNYIIAWGLRRWTRLEVQDYVALLQLQNGYAVTEMRVDEHDWLAGKTLRDLALPREGVLVLGIQCREGQYTGAPHAEDRIQAGDVLILYGPLVRLNELDQRCCGHSGEQAHNEAVRTHKAGVSPVVRSGG